jgi:predicted metal-dependent phosphotriesterase family hydrolase
VSDHPEGPAPLVVRTTTGDVPADQLGVTLPHEHTYITLWEIPGRFDYSGQVDDEDTLADELADFVAAGGHTLVDLTLPGMGRDVAAVARLAERVGLQAVVGTGWYREPYYPPQARVDRRSVASLADEMVHEITVGIDDSGIRAGVIGEIGTDKPWVSAQEERVFRAAGRAQAQTGLAVTTHTIASRVGLDQLDLLEAEGADPAKVAIGHADWMPDLDYYLAIVGRGAMVEMDSWGHPDARSRGLEGRAVDLLLELLHRGHERHLLLSHDVCYVENLKRFGGNGFTYLHDRVLPMLRERGVPEDAIRTITVDNPARLLGFPAPAGVVTGSEG